MFSVTDDKAAAASILSKHYQVIAVVNVIQYVYQISERFFHITRATACLRRSGFAAAGGAAAAAT